MSYGMRVAMALAVCVGIGGLVGCATPRTAESNGAVAPLAATATEGELLVKMIGVQRLSAFNSKWGALVVRETSTGARIELKDTAPAAASYSLFAGPVPQGRYEIAEFRNSGDDAMSGTSRGLLFALLIQTLASDSGLPGAAQGHFVVRSGTLTNLGTIVSAVTPKQGSGMTLALLSDRAAQDSAMADLAPSTRSRFTVMPVVGWDKAVDPQAAVNALEIVRRYAQSVSTMESTPDGTVMLGSALGLIHVRDPAGRWSTMSTGTLDTITSVKSLGDGGIFAGADNGRYFVWSPRQAAWSSHRVVDGERITDMEILGSSGFAIATQTMPLAQFGRFTNKVWFKSDLTDGVPAEALMDMEGRLAARTLPMFFDGRELSVYFNGAGVLRTADVLHFDPRSRQKRKSEASFWAMNLYRLPDRSVVLERLNGISPYNDFSTDDGKTWQRASTESAFRARYADRQTGYGLSRLKMGWKTVTLSLSKTVDGGATWALVGAPFVGSDSFAIRFVGPSIFVFTGLQLLSTRDDGASWKVEWPIGDAMVAP